jgi:rhamnogalacturonan I rhamnosyltransferase
MGWKAHKAGFGGDRLRLATSSAAAARSRVKLWMVRATTTVLLWACVLQLTAVRDTWGPRVLKGWPSCLSAPEAAAVRTDPVVDKPALPPKSECHVTCSALVAFSRSFALFGPAQWVVDPSTFFPGRR